jgi:hypothetical protein
MDGPVYRPREDALAVVTDGYSMSVGGMRATPGGEYIWRRSVGDI